MCGINGALAFSETGKQYLSRIESSSETLKKRGPDGTAFFQDINIALGHCRLSIIDVSHAADQPMYSDDGRWVIVFNGEIFNFKELKAQYLTSETFRTQSDTEVFLKLYIKYKEKSFELLRGFFAAAIYDKDSGDLIIARDRFGKKPLLYYVSEDLLVFASEMKSLLAFGIPKKINWNILPVYFQLNYIPQPYSIIEGVSKLEPGSYLKIAGNSLSIHQYYNLKKEQGSYNKYTYEDAQKTLIQKMDEAVRLRLISDVPLGAFLSGGIDSSVVTALAAQHTDKLSTFSIGYKDHPYFDETRYAKLVANKYNTDHTVFSLSNNDFVEHVFDVLEYIDEPFADSSAIPEFILSYHTRKHVTVALSGDGGDEVFGGYNKHAAEYNMLRKGWKSQTVALLNPLWKILPKSRSNKITNLFRQLNRYATAANLSGSDRYWQWASFQTEEEALELFDKTHNELINNDLSKSIKNQFTSGINGDLNDFLLADMKLVLLSDMLIKVDLMSMANSLEIRSPFLDQDVVSFAFSIPPSYKINNGLKKRIVQDAFRKMLPDELYNRPKQGFEIPLKDWLCKEFWGLINDDLLSESFIKEQGIFNPVVINNLKTKLRSSNPGDSHATIWALVVFQYWWKKYIA
jgi:asparagine synthase (glutamine-hydrolysing)